MFNTEKKIKETLERILGQETKDIPELIQNIRALIDPDDAPAKLKKEIARLKKEVSRANNSLADVKAQKKRELQEVEHLVKIKQEKLEVEHEKLSLKLQSEYKDKEMKLQSEYHDKIIAQLSTAKEDMQAVHKSVLDRLPNLNASLEISRHEGGAKTTCCSSKDDE